jgi:hypothetical protein
MAIWCPRAVALTRNVGPWWARARGWCPSHPTGAIWRIARWMSWERILEPSLGFVSMRRTNNNILHWDVYCKVWFYCADCFQSADSAAAEAGFSFRAGGTQSPGFSTCRSSRALRVQSGPGRFPVLRWAIAATIPVFDRSGMGPLPCRGVLRRTAPNERILHNNLNATEVFVHPGGLRP